MPSFCLALPPTPFFPNPSGDFFSPLLSFLCFSFSSLLTPIHVSIPWQTYFPTLVLLYVTLLEGRVVLSPRPVLDFAYVLILTGAFGQEKKNGS